MVVPVHRVLILSCTAKKRADAGLLPALERYDGPTFRVLRSYLRDRPTDPPHVHILSAEFGLIPASHPIPYYDRPMTRGRAHEMRAPVQQSLAAALGDLTQASFDPEHLLVCLGREYREALIGYVGPVAEVIPSRCVRAGLGRRLTILRHWLLGQSWNEPRESSDLVGSGRCSHERERSASQYLDQDVEQTPQ